MKQLLRRKLPLLFLFLCIIFVFGGCHTAKTAEDDTLSVVTTVFPPYDFTKAITDGVDGVVVTQLLRPGMESHTFDPTPADMLTVEHCDIFIYTGGESDAWVETLLAAVDNSDMRVLRMMECVETVAESTVEGMTVRGEHDHNEHAHEPDSDHVEYDEHVWTDPNNAIKISEAITAMLCEADVANATLYEIGLAAYIEQLHALDETFMEITGAAAHQTLIFGDRFPFRYLCDAYGLSYRAAFPGCASESEPSAYTLAFLIDKVQNEKLPAIFTIEMSNGKIASAIAEETGAGILTLHSCHNRTADEVKENKTYLDLMYENADAMRIALGSKVEENEKGSERK